MKDNLRAHKEKTAIRNSQICGDFLIVEFLIALERLGIFAKISKGETFSAAQLAREHFLNFGLILAVCEFLSEQEVFEKLEEDSFRFSTVDPAIKNFINYFLAYRELYNFLDQIIAGKRTYEEYFLREEVRYKEGRYASSVLPTLLPRFKELGVHSILDVGGNIPLMRALSEEMPSCRYITIEDSPLVADEMREIMDGLFHGGSTTVLRANAAKPGDFAGKIGSVQAIVGITAFHDLCEKNDLASLLAEYKNFFTGSRLFIVEFNIPDWDVLRREPKGVARYIAAISKITHHFKGNTMPQPKEVWLEAIGASGWHLVRAKEMAPNLIIFECE